MSLNKPSGQMYPWAYTWNPVAGECPHRCGYCYVSAKISPWLRRMGNDKYSGPPRLVETEFTFPLIVPKGYIVFVQSCGDLFADGVPNLLIQQVLNHIGKYPQTTFLLQTKNPQRFHDFNIPPNCILGTTLETDRDFDVTQAPTPWLRYLAMKDLPVMRRRMVSIEPVMDFNLRRLSTWISRIHPGFVSVGADSGHNGLPEPSPQKLRQLLRELEGITEVRRKDNLARLLE